MKFSKPVIIGGIWFFLGLIYSSQSFFYSHSVGREYAWQRSLFHSFLFCLEWGLLTLVVLRLAGRFPLDDRNFGRNIGIHFLFGIAVDFFQQMAYILAMDFIFIHSVRVFTQRRKNLS